MAFKYFWAKDFVSESLMKARKVIKAKVLELRKGKEELLRREYENCNAV